MDLTTARRLADRLITFRAPLDAPIDHADLHAAYMALDTDEPRDIARRHVLINAR